MSPRARALLLGLVLLARCAPGGDMPPLAAAPAGPYRLGPGDKIRVLTVSDRALNGDFRVSAGGDIELPMLGRFHAAGFSASGLARALDYALKAAGLERAPSVAIEVLRYRPVFVLGEVNKPGAFPYQPGMTVLAAVALAGGFTYRAVEGYAGVVRTRGGRAAPAARALPDAALVPGDVVRILERRF
ncbi:MAG: polysaccharide export protein [Rhodospirillales bacterium]|nr:polysaccharide export protein [Rhodospirillales bacterium]